MVAPVVVVGIAAGAVVFVGTILTVFFLLHQGGSFDRMRQEAAGLPTAVDELKPQLYDELLAHARELPRQPAPLGQPLRGVLVSVRDLALKQDAPLLHAISNGQPSEKGGAPFDADELIWRHLDQGPFADETAFAAAMGDDLPTGRRFVLELTDSKRVIGMVSLVNHSPQDLRVEISDLWLTPASQGTGAHTEAVALLLRHLFDGKYRRVEWRCDGHNVRARRAAHSLGFSFEGVMRKHRVVKDCNRDTVVFAAINSDWPAMADQLGPKLAALAANLQETAKAAAKTKAVASTHQQAATTGAMGGSGDADAAALAKAKRKAKKRANRARAKAKAKAAGGEDAASTGSKKQQ